MSILIVDDNVEICNLVEEILLMEGYKTRCCTNPTIVFEMINQQKPKLIITDMLMSGLDGRELIKTIKNDEKLSDIKTMLMSAHQEAEKISKQINTDGFVSKPFDIEEFTSSVANLMQ